MNKYADKTSENKSRTVANNLSNQQNNSKSNSHFVDNRPEAIAQRKLQEIVNNNISRPEHSNPVVQLMPEDEEDTLTNWVHGEGRVFLAHTPPGRIDDAAPSQAVRLRWFDVRIGSRIYKTVGLNIHYQGGTIGGIWFVNSETKDSMEFHPYKPPRHGFDGELAFELARHVKDETLKDKIHPRL